MAIAVCAISFLIIIVGSYYSRPMLTQESCEKVPFYYYGASMMLVHELSRGDIDNDFGLLSTTPM